MKIRISLITVLSLILLIAFSTALFAKDYVSIIDGNKAIKGKLAPRFKVETLDGDTFNLSKVRGKKPIVISFWATWCEPCKKELPYVQKFYEKYSDSVEVIAISIDEATHKKIVKNTVKDLGLEFTIGLDPENKLRDKIYPSEIIPYLVIIDSDGKIMVLKEGAPEPEKVMAELEDWLGDQIKPNKAETAE